MSVLDPTCATRASAVTALAEALYGEPLGAMDGVLHVVAVAEEDGKHSVLKIGPYAPKSAWDFFALSLSRARVESILVTGAVLRAEPDLRYELSGGSAGGLRAWRDEVAGLREPPILLVLTRGEIALDHPALHGWGRAIVLTSEESASRLRGRSGIEIVGVADPSARAAIAYLRDRGCRSVSIEAGPRTAAPLYDPPLIDELMRSVYEGALDPRARGGILPEPSHLTRVSSSRPTTEPWRFERWARTT